MQITIDSLDRRAGRCAIVALCCWTTMAPASTTTDAGGVLALAEGVGRWLIANAQEEARGISWPDDVLQGDAKGYDLAAGASGKVLFFTALYRATGEPEYRRTAEQGADYLVGLLDDPESFSTNPRRAGLYSGIPGIGVALINIQAISPSDRYAAAIRRISNLLAEWSFRDESGLHWNDDFNDLLFGEAGTTLYLAFAAQQTDDPLAMQLAGESAQFLLSLAHPADVGSFWYFRRSKDFNLPNYSHGTAGIAYVFATLWAITQDPAYRTAAEQGTDYLDSIAVRDGESIRLPYGWGLDSWTGVFEYGWAHGLAGDALFLERLQQTGIRIATARSMSQQIRRTLTSLDFARTPAAPFGEAATALDRRFGRAGVLSLFSEWGRDDDGVHAARESLRRILEEAAIRDDDGVHWEVEAPGFMGGGTAAFTGYFHGAAGIGLAFLGLHAALTGQDAYVVMPDDPFAWPLGEAQ